MKLQILDANNNVVQVAQSDVTVRVNGSASASLIANKSDPTELVDITDGVGNIYITSPRAEIPLGLGALAPSGEL